MAKFIYRMQNILDIKYKLEEQAKQEYMTVQARLNEEKDRLQDLEDRKAAYFTQYRILLQERLDILEIETCKNAIILMDEYIHNQQLVVGQVEKELEQAIRKMNEAMQERKIHEKLREKQWETFLQELSQEEMKEIDQLISYQYNHGQEQEE